MAADVVASGASKPHDHAVAVQSKSQPSVAAKELIKEAVRLLYEYKKHN